MSLDKGKMPKIDASGYRYAIAASRFNKELVDALVRDAVGTLHRCGVDAENIRLVRVPARRSSRTCAAFWRRPSSTTP